MNLTTPDEVAAPFSLVAWNVFQGLEHSARPRHSRRNEDLVDKLKDLDADVLVLPEAWRHGRPDATWAEDVASALGYELHQWLGDQPSRRREMSRWRMVILTRIPARRLDDQVLTKIRSLGQRSIVRVELTSKHLTLAGVHLYGIHALKTGPRNWLRERSELRGVTARDDIVAGDFNMWGPIVRRDANSLQSTVRGRTFPAAHPHSQIDHVLVSERVEVVESQVLPNMGSDHRAVRVVLKPTSGPRC